MGGHLYGPVAVDGNAHVIFGDVHNHYHGDDPEALSAIGTASAAIQFLDFSEQLIGDKSPIIDAEPYISIEDIKDAIKTMIRYSTYFDASLESSSYHEHDGEHTFLSLIDLCRALIDRLLTCLRVIQEKAGNNSTDSRWLTFEDAIRTVWHDATFADFVLKREECRARITPQILLLLNSRLIKLQTGQNQILEVIAITSNSTVGKSDRAGIGTEALAAITTSRDGSCRTLLGPTSTGLFGSHVVDQGSGSGHNVLQLKSDEASKSENSLEVVTNFNPGKMGDITGTVLASLHFRTIGARIATVSLAHQRTFCWVFDDPRVESTPWDNLRTWLLTGSGCYWINGKAGSGKSTLMKYIFQHEQLKILLSEWAKSNSLTIASHFFWYAGSALHKSQQGLIRSLLASIINSQPHLAVALFPDLCRYMLTNLGNEGPTLSDIELKQAFYILPRIVPHNLKIFLLIDGVDEYAGDYEELFELILNVSSSPSIKILLSSRPTPSCVRAFSTFKGLRLQDLTRRDIRVYAEDALSLHPVMFGYEKAQAGAIALLVDGITVKASGVFLWVALAIRRLKYCLDNYDTLKDLIRTLDELPEDLERLYELMLESIDYRYIEEGSRMMHATLASMKWAEDYPLTALQLSYIDDGSYFHALREPAGLIEEADENWCCESIEGRLRSRCCGLLEVQTISRSGYDLKIVAFLHRTVFDFLEERTSSIIHGTFQNAPEDISNMLLGSSLRELQARADSDHKREDSPSYLGALRLLKYLEVLCISDRHRLQYVAALQAALGSLWYEKRYFPDIETQSSAVETVVIRHSSSSMAIDRMLLATALQCPSVRCLQLIRSILQLKEISEDRADLFEICRDDLALRLFMAFIDTKTASVRHMALNSIRRVSAMPERTIPIGPLANLPLDPGWKKYFAGNSTNSLSLWRFVLHYMYRIQSEDSQHSNLDPETTRALLAMVLGFLLKGAKSSTSINVMAPKLQRSSAQTKRIEAKNIINDFLQTQTHYQWKWTHYDTLRMHGRHDNLGREWDMKIEMAQLCLEVKDCLLKSSQKEHRLPKVRISGSNSSGASPISESGRTGTSSTSGSTLPPSRIPRLVNSRSFGRSGVTIEPRGPWSKQPKNGPKPAVAGSVKDTGDTNTTERISPWRQFLLDRQLNESKESEQQGSMRPSKEMSESHRDASNTAYDTWAFTAPAQRIDLLEEDDQELSQELAKSEELTKKEHSALMRRFMRLPETRRVRVLECSKIIEFGMPS